MRKEIKHDFYPTWLLFSTSNFTNPENVIELEQKKTKQKKNAFKWLLLLYIPWHVLDLCSPQQTAHYELTTEQWCKTVLTPPLLSLNTWQTQKIVDYLPAPSTWTRNKSQQPFLQALSQWKSPELGYNCTSLLVSFECALHTTVAHYVSLTWSMLPIHFLYMPVKNNSLVGVIYTNLNTKSLHGRSAEDFSTEASQVGHPATELGKFNRCLCH